MLLCVGAMGFSINTLILLYLVWVNVFFTLIIPIHLNPSNAYIYECSSFPVFLCYELIILST